MIDRVIFEIEGMQSRESFSGQKEPMFGSKRSEPVAVSVFGEPKGKMLQTAIGDSRQFPRPGFFRYFMHPFRECYESNTAIATNGRETVTTRRCSDGRSLDFMVHTKESSRLLPTEIGLTGGSRTVLIDENNLYCAVGCMLIGHELNWKAGKVIEPNIFFDADTYVDRKSLAQSEDVLFFAYAIDGTNEKIMGREIEGLTGYRTQVAALSKDNLGEVLWQRTGLDNVPHYAVGTPFLHYHEGVLFVYQNHHEGASLFAFDAETGKDLGVMGDVFEGVKQHSGSEIVSTSFGAKGNKLYFPFSSVFSIESVLSVSAEVER